jgi:hypothetical protein
MNMKTDQSPNITCVGCRDNGCVGKESCKNLRCCREKGFSGCWECNEFPCKRSMLDNLRIRAFALFVKENGVEALLDRLQINEEAGIKYHYSGQLNGDYDIPVTEERIIDMIKHGKEMR